MVGHQVALFDADAMLARQHTANLDTQPQYISAEFLSALFEIARLHHVEQDQRMQVAVAGMEDVAETQLMLFRQLFHLGQHEAAGRGAGMEPSMQIISGASRPMAANAALRPDQMRARCFSSVASTAWCRRTPPTIVVTRADGIADIRLHAVGSR